MGWVRLPTHRDDLPSRPCRRGACDGFRGGLNPSYALLPKIETILRVTQDALKIPSRFDPASSTRSFRLAGNDLVGALIAPSLFGLLRKEAPGCRVAFQFAVGAESLNGLRANDLDLAIGRIRDLSDDFSATPGIRGKFRRRRSQGPSGRALQDESRRLPRSGPHPGLVQGRLLGNGR